MNTQPKCSAWCLLLTPFVLILIPFACMYLLIDFIKACKKEKKLAFISWKDRKL